MHHGLALLSAKAQAKPGSSLVAHLGAQVRKFHASNSRDFEASCVGDERRTTSKSRNRSVKNCVSRMKWSG